MAQAEPITTLHSKADTTVDLVGAREQKGQQKPQKRQRQKKQTKKNNQSEPDQQEQEELFLCLSFCLAVANFFSLSVAAPASCLLPSCRRWTSACLKSAKHRQQPANNR